MWLDRLGPLKRIIVWLWGHLPLPDALSDWLQWLFSSKFMIGTACIVFDGAGRVLLVKHTYKRHPWGLPGGGMNQGETTEQGALRELREEACFEGRIIRLLGVRTRKAERMVNVFYLCDGEAREFKPSVEIAERGWFDPDDLPAGTTKRLRALLVGLKHMPDGLLRDDTLASPPTETVRAS